MDKRLRIAVADDEPDMQQFFKKILPRIGYEVLAVASNGRELVEQVDRTRPDLVITDIKMPELDGMQAAREIWRIAEIPIILVSAYHPREFIGQAESSPIMVYLVKPIKRGDVEPAITLATSRFQQFASGSAGPSS